MSSRIGALRGTALASLVFLMGCGQSDAFAQDRSHRTGGQQTANPAAPADTTTAFALSQTFRAAAAEALPGVVTIQVTAEPQARRGMPFPFPFRQEESGNAPPQIGTGSGFVFSADGYIVTNNHVVANATDVQVQFTDGRIYDHVEIVGRDPNTDVAVIKIEPRSGDELQPLEIGNSDALQVGDWVLALGNPLSLGFTVTAGIVSAKGRSLRIIEGDYPLEAFIQTDAAINRGNSGGPLVDLYGRVVGINTAIYSETGMYAGNGFAVPIALAAKAANDIIEYGYVRRPRIGVLIQDVTEAQADLYDLDEISGAYITEVQPDGPAADAGIEAEDIIVGVNGEPVQTAGELTTRLARMQPGDRVTLDLIRDGDRTRVRMELGEFEIEQPETRVAQAERSAEEMLGVAVMNVSDLTRDDMQAINLDDRDIDGVVVTDVSRYGPAASSLVQGDVILEFNRQPVNNVRDLRRLADRVERGDVVLLRVRRRSSGNVGVVSFRIR